MSRKARWVDVKRTATDIDLGNRLIMRLAFNGYTRCSVHYRGPYLWHRARFRVQYDTADELTPALILTRAQVNALCELLRALSLLKRKQEDSAQADA